MENKTSQLRWDVMHLRFPACSYDSMTRRRDEKETCWGRRGEEVSWSSAVLTSSTVRPTPSATNSARAFSSAGKDSSEPMRDFSINGICRTDWLGAVRMLGQ